MVVVNLRASPRVALVTGGTDGIGRAVALRLARGGDRVIFVGRDEERGAETLSALRALRPGVQHVFLRADLSLLAETARVAAEIGRHTARLDAAVFCAGVLAIRPEWTAEGLERSFVLNYLSRFLLAQWLAPALLLAPSGRLVFVANAGKYSDDLQFADLHLRRGRSGLYVSGRTQFANDLVACELAARLRDTRVQVTCVYPGVVRTGVLRNARGLPALVRGAAALLQPLIASAPEAAAQTPAYLAQDPAANGTNGCFYGPRCRQRPVPARALDRERRRVLWETSHALVRDYLPDLHGDDSPPALFVIRR